MNEFVRSTAIALLMVACLAPSTWAEEASSQCRPVDPVPAHSQRRPANATSDVLALANASARQSSERSSFLGARQIYAYAPGAIYELRTNPHFVSTLLLEPGETLNDVAAGDTSRWMVTETSTEAQSDGRTVVLVKPLAPNLRTNIVLVTDRRTYTIEAIARDNASYAAEIAWCYPQADANTPTPPSIDHLNFAYRVRTVHGRTPTWSPVRVFDDGRHTWIEASAGAAFTELPPLFVITPEGAELTNYRVQGQRYMIDRLFDVAELRLGTHAPVIVRIEREGVAATHTRIGGARS